jgi:hyperosmotically inducible periplasmic protein
VCETVQSILGQSTSFASMQQFTHAKHHQDMRPRAFLALAIAAALSSPLGSFAANNDHNDAFVNGAPNENRVAQEVRHRLVSLPYYGIFDDLAFRVDGGTVTLLGEVTQPVLKTDAERSLKGLEGVEHIVNEIEVLPLSPMDDQIRFAVYKAIYGDPALSTRYGYRSIPPIHIIVKNGHVKLEGVVADQGDKNIAGIRANSIGGVFSVENDLQVEKGSTKKG